MTAKPVNEHQVWYVSTGPWFQGDGDTPHRVVLRAFRHGSGETYKYVTHMECMQLQGRLIYDSGHYFDVGVYGEAFTEAISDFNVRMNTHVKHYAPLVESGLARCLSDDDVRAK